MVDCSKSIGDLKPLEALQCCWQAVGGSLRRIGDGLAGITIDQWGDIIFWIAYTVAIAPAFIASFFWPFILLFVLISRQVSRRGQRRRRAGRSVFRTAAAADASTRHPDAGVRWRFSR
jgi:hypothetical protein